MDNVAKEQRSKIMRAVKSRNTQPELLVRRLAHALGIRFRVNICDLPGKPDLAIKSKRKAIFVHGCFWHRHKGCRRATMPQTNHEDWSDKFNKTIDRDARTLAKYREMGWETMVVWECELRDTETVLRRLATFFGKRADLCPPSVG